MCSFDCSSTQGSGVQLSARTIWGEKYPDLSREWLPPPWHHHPAHEGRWGAEECQPDRPGIQRGLALPPDQECVLHTQVRRRLQLQGHPRNQSHEIHLGWVTCLDNGTGVQETGWLYLSMTAGMFVLFWVYLTILLFYRVKHVNPIWDEMQEACSLTKIWSFLQI